MRIGIILYPTFGGSGVVATEIGHELAKRGHQVHFISYKRPARLEYFAANIQFHQVNVADYPLFEFAPYETALTGRITDVALKYNLDLIHAHYAIPHASAALMAREILKTKGRYVPIITTLHGTDITMVGRDAALEPSVTYAINSSDAVTAVSRSLKNDTLRNFQITREIQVIYNFIDPSLYGTPSPDCLKNQVAPNGEKVVVHVSNFRKVKRIPDVIDIFARIRNSMPAKLIMGGDGPERTDAERKVLEMGLENDVTFLGSIKNSSDVLACADLLLLPSETESFGVSALEAMVSGVPVVASNAGGMPEVQENGVTGYMCDVGDIESMAEKAVYILSDAARLERFREGARMKATEFSTEKIISQYEELYQQVLDTARAVV
ncbi:MAG: N-acetyl-alpha-D-glucosaminyl L-malate synthase BshA [Bacteroidia bacterium]|nr:N-acetyl-alpha-D-glucosaminyl L-malate synthase BshA [Bacteroidia bacterium]